MAGTYLLAPTPIVDIIGWEDDAAVLGGVTLTLPAASLLTGGTGETGDMDVTLPSMEISIAGVTDNATNVFQQPLVIPMLVISVAGISGVIGGAQLALPGLALQVYGQDATNLALPAHTLAVSAVTGNTGAMVLAPAPASLAVSGSVPFVASSALVLRPSLTVAGSTGAAGGVATSLRALALAASGYTGAVCTASMVLPVMELSIGGYEAHVGNVVLALPMLALQITGRQGAGATFNTVVMHTESNALTTYENYQFNSFAQFNSVYLGASDSGIFALTGATDNGVLIDAAARLGVTDFGTSHMKRVDRCYVGYRADGNMVLRVTTDEDQARDYLLTATGKTGLHGNHARIGKGLAARYWQFEIRNKDGSDFELDVLEVKPTALRRRIGGGNG